ncbi:metacaspase-1-like [Salvia splendens]|uniref:metacaspase-1-like n=1 Tax=Salvia splendens TaxID=180675 RepID=UPI001C253708|nr:metacaspase-1-like [Salvia splendens]
MRKNLTWHHRRRRRQSRMDPTHIPGKKQSKAPLPQASLGTALLHAASFHDKPCPGRRALVCGVSYKKHDLKRSALGVRKMRELLLYKFSFSPESVLILAEEDWCPPPTRRNIEEGFQWLVRGIRSGDSLLFYFTGHGKQEKATGDEIDETICPVDFEENGVIADNFINCAIVEPLVTGVKLHAIVDSGHVGTILDLPRVYEASMSFENKVDNHINHAIVRRPCVKLHTIKAGTILDLPRGPLLSSTEDFNISKEFQL